MEYKEGPDGAFLIFLYKNVSIACISTIRIDKMCGIIYFAFV